MDKNKFGYYQGEYQPINVAKYVGRKKPFCRSGWEKRVMYWLDNNPAVVEWASEPFSFQYPWYDTNRQPSWKQYIPDFYAKIMDVNGVESRYVIEVKPKAQCVPPKEPKIRNTKRLARYQVEMVVYQKNQMKWKYARAICAKRGFKFVVIDEKDIFTI